MNSDRRIFNLRHDTSPVRRHLCPLLIPLSAEHSSSHPAQRSAPNPICSPFVFMVLQIAFPPSPFLSQTSALPPGCTPSASKIWSAAALPPLSRCTNHFPFSPGARSRTIRRLCLVYPAERRESSRSRHPSLPHFKISPLGHALQRRFCLQYTLPPGSSPHPALTQLSWINA